jgi:hypothetical protein
MKNKIIAFFATGFLIIFSFLLWRHFTNLSKSNQKLIVSNNICSQFSNEFVGNAISKTVSTSKEFNMKTAHVCDYFLTGNTFLSIKSQDLNVEQQKKGNVYLGLKISNNSQIQMNHFIATQKNNEIKTIYLILDPNKFVAIDRNSLNSTDNNGMIKLAVKVANQIQK